MFGRGQHPSGAPPLEDVTLADLPVPSRACCCPARPAVKVIMPPTAGRKQPVDLWLCGRHYRASFAALMKAGARIEDLTVMIADRPQGDRAELPA